MGFKIMTENGLQKLSGGVNQDLLNRISLLESSKLDIGKVTQAKDVTAAGYAADARELNAGLDGTLANRAEKATKGLETVAFKELETKSFGYISSLAELDTYTGVNGTVFVNEPGHYGSVLCIKMESITLQAMFYSAVKKIKIRYHARGTWTEWVDIMG